MGHRKQLLLSPSSHHLIRMTRTRWNQATSSPSPTISHRISGPLILVRSASLPVSLVEERGETKRQASNADTSDNAKSSPSSHPTDLTDRHGASNRTATGTGTRRLTSTPSPPPSKQGETPDTIASPLPAANRREPRTGRDGRHRPHHQPRRARASKQPTPAAPPHRRDTRDEKRADSLTDATRRASR